MTKPPTVFGLVLAGGHSRRFGRDKAAEQFRGSALLDRAVAALAGILDEVFVSVRVDQTADDLRARYALIVDRDEGLGPAGGILSAHARFPDVAWLVLACDLPNISATAVTALLRARRPGKAATSYQAADGGGAEPLCAIYEPDTLARFRLSTESGGDLSPRNFLADQEVELVAAPSAHLLSNVNTPEELSRLKTTNQEDEND
jgi:molybdopterin-guanine dinucleotide biosynthesis protein A